MKKHILPLLFFITASTYAQECCEEETCCDDRMNFYAKVLSGGNFLQKTNIQATKTSYKAGYIIDGSLGFTWRPYNLSLEAEYAFRKNGINHIQFFSEGSSSHGHFQTSSYIMGNLLWDLPLNCYCIQPYFGAGLGYDFQQMHASNSRIIFNEKWHHFSWQLMAGLTYPIFCNTEIILEYKFHQGGSDFNNNSIAAGLVYKFGFIR